MFSNWKQEKTTTALIDEAQTLADKLAQAKPHIVDHHAAAACFWAGFHASNGQNLHEMIDWKPAAISRFAAAALVKIAALRKQRAYDSSDGLAIWMHTARAISEPRIAPAVRDIWRHIAAAGPNMETMAMDLLQEEGLPLEQIRQVPKGFG